MKTYEILKSAGKVAIAPFVGLFYVIMMPFVFAFAIGLAVVKGLARLTGVNLSFGWRPLEAYLGGKKIEKREGTGTKTDEKQ